MAGLEISPEKVGFVIVKAREIAAKVAAWDDGATTDHDAESILESFSEDATQEEIKGFIADLNEDEQASLSTSLLAIPLLGEALSLVQITGGLMILFGIRIVHVSRANQ